MDDALKYLSHWGLEPGTPEAVAAWKQKQEFDSGYRFFHAPMVFVQPDICYDSPIDGRPITNLQARKEDLARSGVARLCRIEGHARRGRLFGAYCKKNG